MCKYDYVCERLYCMFKHGKQKKAMFDQTVDETGVFEEKNVHKKHENSEECGEIVIVEVEIVNVDEHKIIENVEMISENDPVQENNVDDAHDDVLVELDSVRIVDVEDVMIENETSDDKEEANDDNIELIKKVQKEPPATDKIAGSLRTTSSFKCSRCEKSLESFETVKKTSGRP